MFRQRNQLLGNVSDKYRVDGFFLNQLFKHLLRHFVVFHLGGNFHAKLFASVPATIRRQIPPVITGCFGDQLFVGSALPRALQVDGFGHVAFGVFVLDLQAATIFLCQVTNQLLDQVGHLFKI